MKEAEVTQSLGFVPLKHRVKERARNNLSNLNPLSPRPSPGGRGSKMSKLFHARS